MNHNNIFINYICRISEINQKLIEASAHQIVATQTYANGVYKYFNDFLSPYWTALNAFQRVENDKVKSHSPLNTMLDYVELLKFNQQIADTGLAASLKAMNRFHVKQLNGAFSALFNTFFDTDEEDIATFMKRQSELMRKVVYDYPKAIRDIKPEYGFHFDEKDYIKVAETDRFFLYQVFPLDESVKVRENGKPIVIIPPYVLGANILAFLPGEGKSYVHCFANQGIPTYIRIMKDIDTTPAVQTMTGEDDAMDTRFFCEKVMARHNRAVTLNGFCQGGFIAVADILSGMLDDLVDALITCAAPMDGTRSKSLVEYMEHLPRRFRDLGYAVKILPNGNQVVDGEVMSWVYKLKSMEREAPLFTFYRDLAMFDQPDDQKVEISKTAAAINHWLIYDRTDLPEAITKMSFDSYTVPVAGDGTLPVELFGRKLNFKRLKEKGIRFLICIAEKDDLVDKESALAPLDYIDAEVTVFPKGHASIATSWSHPRSECALHTRFRNNYRGPVRFQLDLEQER